LKKIKMVF